MQRRFYPDKATLYDFRDLDIMHRLAESEDSGYLTAEVADMLGFRPEEGARPVGIRLAWMRRYGMVAFDEKQKLWSLSNSGKRVVKASELAPKLKVIENMPNEKMIEVMAHVTSRFQRGETMLGHMLRREFLFGTKRR
jgi:hypothetical protein